MSVTLLAIYKYVEITHQDSEQSNAYYSGVNLYSTFNVWYQVETGKQRTETNPCTVICANLKRSFKSIKYVLIYSQVLESQRDVRSELNINNT